MRIEFGEVAQKFTYTNWRGETRERWLLPVHLWWGATEWHTEPQWLLNAVDCVEGTVKDFALSGFVLSETRPPVAENG
jgi:hypothetical protein